MISVTNALMSDYYISHAQSYSNKAMSFDMSDLYDYFLPLVKPEGKILDLGCGSGRDMKALKERGYDVIGLDSSLPLVEMAREYTGCQVDHKAFMDMEYEGEFDGVLAVASVLHVPKKELHIIFSKVLKALKQSGIFLVSFQYGEKTRIDKYGRLFTDMTEESLHELLQELNDKFNVINIYKNQHAVRKKDYWLTALLQKK